MNGLAERFACEAEQLSGVPFRLHGRDPATGLDCIGVAACALDRAGGRSFAPSVYTLRNLGIDRFLGAVTRSGFEGAAGVFLRGDLVMVSPGPAQHHLLVALGKDRFVNAHAGLRQVVVQRRNDAWPTLYHWRLRAE